MSLDEIGRIIEAMRFERYRFRPARRTLIPKKNGFGSLDHEVMLSTLAERIHDNRFLRLVRNMLTAGYLED